MAGADTAHARPLGDRQERRVDGAARACLLALRAPHTALRGCAWSVAFSGWAGVAIPGWLVGIRLEGCAGPHLDDRASRTDYGSPGQRYVRRGFARLHDRDHDAGTLHQDR